MVNEKDNTLFQIPFWKRVCLVFCAAFFIIKISNAQKIESGRVIYDVYEGNYSNLVEPSGFFNHNYNQPSDDDYAPKSIVLEFRDGESSCGLSQVSTINNNRWSKFKETSLELNGETYYNEKGNELLFVESLDNQQYIVSMNIEKMDWTFLDGTKQIMGYSCKKAFRKKSFKNGSGRLITISYTAWYAPEIDLAFGPYGHVKLPGLIMEIEKTGGHTEFKYIATRVELENNDLVAIERPTEGILITEKEYNSKVRASLKEKLGLE